jgi:hypothetical protein
MKEKSLFHGSKRTGFMMESLYLIVTITIFAIVAVVFGGLYNDLNTDIQAETDMSNSSKTLAAENYSRYSNTTDGVFFALFAFGFIVLLGMAWLSYESPIFLIVLIVLLLAMLIIGAIFANTWVEFTDDDYSTQASNVPITNHILSNFLIYVLVAIGSCGLVLFMRSKF